MLLAPWDRPLPLTRAWCLWELYCTVDTGTTFSVCLGPAQRTAFEVALLESYDVLMNAFAGIDVAHSQAGQEADRLMILGEAEKLPGGCDALNAIALAEMRRWAAQPQHGCVIYETRHAP
jgi:hypothetical protein